MSDLEPSYIHGTTVSEQRRLSLMNAVINPRALTELAPRQGDRVLDVGSGLGQLTRDIARAVGPDGCVVGVERDARQHEESLRLAAGDGEQAIVDFRLGDALALPLSEGEWGSFDVAHARFVLEHVGDPLGVVRQMVRAVRPGGRVVLADDDHDVLRLWPEPPGFGAIWQSYLRTYDRLGNDPYVGRRLVWLLSEAGAAPARNNWLFFGGCSGGPTFDTLAENLISILMVARETVLIFGLLDESSYDAGLDALRAWSRRSDAALWYAICWADGRRP